MNVPAILTILVLLTIILGIIYRISFPPPEALTSAEARSALKHRDISVVIDVRTDEEWGQGHKPDAIHIPILHLAARLPHEVPDRGTPILFYCQTGKRAAVAAQTAQELGYRHVYYLRDGDYTDLAIKTRFAKY